MKTDENTQNEIEQERASYLLSLDDIYYEMLISEPLVARNKSAITSNSYIGIIGEINLANGLIYSEDNKEFTEIIDTQSQMEFPKRKIQQVRPATLEDELAQDSSFSE